MSKVPITTPIVIPAICPADSPSSVGRVAETVGVTAIVVDGGFSNVRLAIVNPALTYLESAAYNKYNNKIMQAIALATKQRHCINDEY